MTAPRSVPCPRCTGKVHGRGSDDEILARHLPTCPSPPPREAA